MVNKSALIVGASGLVGRELLKYLLEEKNYNQITLLGRRPSKIRHPKLIEIIVDFDNLGDYKEYFKVDDVFSCLGTTIKKAKTQDAMKKVDFEYPLNIAKIAKDMGCQQFLLVSSMGADPNSYFWYTSLKGLLEKELKKVGFKSLHLLRPSLLLGSRKEFRLGEIIAAFFSTRLSFAFIGPLRKYRAIAAKTVALCMYKVAQDKRADINIYLSDEIEHIAKTNI